MKKLINLTPHPVKILDEDDEVLEVIMPNKATEELPQIEEEHILDGDDENGYYITLYRAWGTKNLPEPDSKGEKVFIVSQEIALNNVHRDDLYVPEVVRDQLGRVIGCRGFKKYVS